MKVQLAIAKLAQAGNASSINSNQWIYRHERSTTILSLIVAKTESELTPARITQKKLWSALILTGGTSKRFGSDKSEAIIDGTALIDFLISSIPKAVPIVVVGPDRDNFSNCIDVIQESPRGGGPVAGIAAGLPLIQTEYVAIFATDMPFSAALIPFLFEKLSNDSDGVTVVDEEGFQQPFSGIYRLSSLRRVLQDSEPLINTSMRVLLRKLKIENVNLNIEDTHLISDIDTQADLRNAISDSDSRLNAGIARRTVMSTLHEAKWDLARLAARGSVTRLPSEVVALSECMDRTLTKDLLALVDLPTYETSAMDGYAVSGNGPWKIIGDVKAGAPMTELLESGTAVRIATGAVIPSGTFGVVRWEFADVVDETLNAVVNQGGEIRPAGLECRKDQVITRAGTVLTPAWIGLLASAGWDNLEVTRKPRVEIILLGDEIQLSGIPENGLVRDALGPQLPGWLERMGAEVVAMSYVADELQLVVDAITLARTRADLIVTTGGTADGPRDHLHNALESVGAKLIVDRVKVRPGHPMLLADFDSVSLIGLPGNPQSAIVGLMSLGQPVIDALLGRPVCELENVITMNEIRAREDFTRLVLGNVSNGVFSEGEHLGSAMLRGLAHATGFAVAPDGVGAAGSQVKWLPIV